MLPIPPLLLLLFSVAKNLNRYRVQRVIYAKSMGWERWRATTNLGRAANRAMRDLNRRLAGRSSGFAWPAAKSPLQPCGLSPPAKTRMPPHTRHTIMYCVKGVNQKSFSGSKAVAVRTPVRTSSCQSLFLESSAAGCPPGGRALQGGPAVLGRVAASAITVWKSAL